jgi:hypothetical protein
MKNIIIYNYEIKNSGEIPNLLDKLSDKFGKKKLFAVSFPD